MSWVTLHGLLVLLFMSESRAGFNLLSGVANLTSRPIDQIVKSNTDFIKLAAGYGFDAETHEVTTEDGYILTIFRIPPARNCPNKRPLLLMHGLFGEAGSYLISDVDAPGAVLAEECYDVWFGNVRGTLNSRRHRTLDPERHLKYWKYSVDEMGRYDVPAMVDYVLSATGTNKLIYIGFSQGGSAFFIMNSERPEYADKISLFIGLAPGTKPSYRVKSESLKLVLTSFTTLQTPLETVGVWEILTRGFPLQTALSILCQVKLLAVVICSQVLSVLDSPHPGSITTETSTRMFQLDPAGTSVQNLAGFGQTLNGTTKFTKFNYGAKKNLEVYGSSEPPEFNLGAVTMPTVIYHGQADKLLDTSEVEQVINQLPNVVGYVKVEDPLWNHFDNIYSQHWKKTIFTSMKKYLNMYDNIN